MKCGKSKAQILNITLRKMYGLSAMATQRCSFALNAICTFVVF